MTKKNNILRMVLSLCLVLAMGMFTACSLVPEGEQVPNASPSPVASSTADAFTAEELSSNVITVGDYNVTLGEYIKFFDEIVKYYANYGYDVTADADSLVEYKGMITEQLTKEKMILHQASLLGLTELTEEQLAEVQELYDASIDELYDYYTKIAEEEQAEDETVNIDERVEKYVIDEAEYYLGEGTTKEQYFDYLYESSRDGYIVDLLKEHIQKDVIVSEEDIKAWYDDALVDDTSYYGEHPETYKEDREMFDKFGVSSEHATTVPPVVVPEGYSRVLHIFVTADSDAALSEEYTKNETAMEELMHEYGELALEDAINGNRANKARLAEILEEYLELKEANDNERIEFYADAKAKIDEAKGKLDNGEEFFKVMMEYTMDTDITGYTNIQERGLLISTVHSSETDWSSVVKDEFKKLKVGEYSEVFMDDDGYHIIYYLMDETPGVVSLEDAHDDIENYLVPTKQEEVYNAKIEEWMKDEASTIVVNDDLIARIGVA